MPILEFQRPDKVTMIESDDKRGSFEFRPLEPGYGITIGNALRRILLSSLGGPCHHHGAHRWCGP
jgi:DNA-directed RNA polymerase subunit alpha